MSSIEVREARAGDAGAVFALARAMARTFVPDRSSFDAVFRAVVGAPDAHVLVATMDDVVVGYLLGSDHPAFFAGGTTGWVDEIAVRDDLRRRGLGRRLMAELERRLHNRDARLVALATTRAGPFYEALGYTAHATYHRKLL